MGGLAEHCKVYRLAKSNACRGLPGYTTQLNMARAVIAGNPHVNHRRGRKVIVAIQRQKSGCEPAFFVDVESIGAAGGMAPRTMHLSTGSDIAR